MFPSAYSMVGITFIIWKKSILIGQRNFQKTTAEIATTRSSSSLTTKEINDIIENKEELKAQDLVSVF